MLIEFHSELKLTTKARKFSAVISWVVKHEIDYPRLTQNFLLVELLSMAFKKSNSNKNDNM